MRKTLMALLVIPFMISACTPNNVTIDNTFKKYFDSAGVSGSFGLFDNGQGHFTIYNLPGYRDSAYLPASTFDIVSSLIGIQTGLIKDDSAVIHWDPAMIIKPACEDDLNLKADFQHSCEMAFREIARRIGQDTMRKWIDTLGYGNKDTGGGSDSFWLDNHLRITPDEELGLIKKLYFDQLPFFQRTQRIVKGMMLMEANSNYQLSYKTGWGQGKDGRYIGWILGWIEENKHPYLFVLNLGSDDERAVAQNVQVELLKNILKQMGFFEGKK